MKDEAALQLYYYPEDNLLYDEGGYPVWNPFQYIKPAEYHKFLDDCVYKCIWSPKLGCYVELIYVENEVV